MDSGLDAILFANESLNLEVTDCAFITLQDAAFDCKHARVPSKTVSWDQKHLGVALKFSEQNPRWHCIWASMEERDEQLATCVFRSYDDVYLERLHRTPRKKISGESLRVRKCRYKSPSVKYVSLHNIRVTSRSWFPCARPYSHLYLSPALSHLYS